MVDNSKSDNYNQHNDQKRRIKSRDEKVFDRNLQNIV